MADIRLSSSPTVNKRDCSPVNNHRVRTDSEIVIQQSDVSSSRPALLAHDALGPLLFEALDGFFFTINHNFELDSVSDNVGQYLKYSQEELAGRSLYHCVHPSDVGEFSKAWAKKETGDSLATLVQNEQQTVPSRGRTFHCRMRTNDDSTTYVTMVVSVALHRDSLGSDKTFLICIARRPSLNDPKDKSSLLGFDQFSSRIDLNYDIENLDSSHMKCETIDMNFSGKNFRHYVFPSDIPSVERHFQEVIEQGEGKSTVYRFCLHDNVYAFINTRSKLFHNPLTGQSDSILSTHTIVRLIDNNTRELHGNAQTTLMKSIISSNRDLQKNRQPTPTKTSPPPIGTQFALTMLGMHKNASNSLQQHVSSTLGTLIQVQNSFSTSTGSSPNEKTQSQLPPPPSPSPTQNRLNAQKSSTLDHVSSSDAVEFGSKRTAFSPSLGSVHSSHGSLPSPANSFDIFFSSPTPAPNNSNDLSSLLPSPVNHPKASSPFFANNDIYTTSSSPKASTPQQSSRSSTRLRQLLANKSPSTNETPSQMFHYRPETKFEDLIQGPESPTSTHVSPVTNEFSPSSTKRRRKHNGIANGQNHSKDILLKKILEKQNSFTPSPIKTESNHSDDSSSNGHTTDKQRSDIYLRTLLNDEIRPQKVVIEAPFVIGSREKTNRRSSSSNNIFLENNKPITQNTWETLKSQLSLQPSNGSWENKSKRKERQHSNSFGSQNDPPAPPKKPGRPKRDQSDYLLTTTNCQTPQSALSDSSLDALLDSSNNIDQPPIHLTPITLRRTTRQASAANPNDLKRSLDNDEHLSNQRKYPKLLAEALKVECHDPSAISPSTAIAATRPLNQPMIKTEPEIFEQIPLPRRANLNSSTSTNSQSPLLRTLIRTSQTPSSLISKENAPLYDLLQNHDTSANRNVSSIMNSSIDPLEQYLAPVTNNLSVKDDYLAALLSSDPQKPNEISFPSTKQQISNENTRINAIANDLFNSTTLANHSNDNFLSLLDNKDFLESLNDSTSIDSILSQNSSGLIEQTFRSTTPKRSEKDEKAISEIYKTLVTSFNPGLSQQSSTIDSIPVDHSSITDDFLFAESTNSIPPNRTVNSDPLPPAYRQASVSSPSTFSYQPNNTQFSDPLSMDLLDTNNTSSFPPNVTLSPMNNSYPTQITTVMNNNSMMMYSSQPPPTHMQHHQTPPPNALYRQSSQQQPPPPPMYSNYVQQPTNSPYYSMPVSNQTQQRMAPVQHHANQLAKRQTFIQQQQRTSAQMNQQFQLQMSMNVTLPHIAQNQQQQQPPPMSHRPMMNTYNDMMMSNNNAPPLQQDYHQYPNSNPLDLPYSPDLFMSPGSNMGPQSVQNRHLNAMQHHQQAPPLPPSLSHSQATMHQPYSNMSVALSATIQQNTSNSNNLMNSSLPNLTQAECRQSEELNNQMMNCLSFQPTRCTSEFVRKQLQNTIHGRQKPASGKDLSGVSGHTSLSANLDSNQKGAYFRNQLSSPMSTPPLQTSMRSQQPGKNS